MTAAPPTLADLKALARDLGESVSVTPVVECPDLAGELEPGTTVLGKLEFLQYTGTFKARAALAALAGLSPAQRAAGVTAVSAGNHAIATAYAARYFGVSARLVMIASANPARLAACRRFGAEVITAADVHEAFRLAQRIQADQGRYLVHPFEGRHVALGAGLVGREILAQVPEFDALLVPVGGGGLLAGVANAVRQARPDVRIYGVEPSGADSMSRSLAAGEPQTLASVNTIADSLGAPFAMPYSFALVRDNVDRLCTVTDDELRRAMRLLFSRLHLAVEPACAATTAAACGPLRQELAGKRVVLLFCGSNIDWHTWADHARFDRAHAA